MTHMQGGLRGAGALLLVASFSLPTFADTFDYSFSESDAVVLNLTEKDFGTLLHRFFQEEIDEGIRREKDDPKRGWWGLEYSVDLNPPEVFLHSGGRVEATVGIEAARGTAVRFARTKADFDIDCMGLRAEMDPEHPLKVVFPFQFAIDGDLIPKPGLPTIINRTDGIILHKPTSCSKGGALLTLLWPFKKLVVSRASEPLEGNILRSLQRSIARISKDGLARRRFDIKTLGGDEESFPLWVYPQTVSTDHGSFYVSLGAGTEGTPPSPATPSTLLPGSERSYLALSVGLINQVSARSFESLRSIPVPVEGDIARVIAYNLFEEAKELGKADVISVRLNVASPPRFSVDAIPGRARIRLQLDDLELSLLVQDKEGWRTVGVRVVERVNVAIAPYIGPLGLAWQIDEVDVKVRKNRPDDRMANRIRAALQELVFAQLWSSSLRGVGVGFLKNENGDKGYFDAVGDKLIVDLNRTGAFKLQGESNSQAKR